jgi:hypothetical protein
MWKPQHLTALWASTACYRDSFYIHIWVHSSIPYIRSKTTPLQSPVCFVTNFSCVYLKLEIVTWLCAQHAHLLSTCDWFASHTLLQTRPSFKFYHCLANINSAFWFVVFRERLGEIMKQMANFVEPVTLRMRLDRVVLQMNVTEQKTESFHRPSCNTQLTRKSVSRPLQKKTWNKSMKWCMNQVTADEVAYHLCITHGITHGIIQDWPRFPKSLCKMGSRTTHMRAEGQPFDSLLRSIKLLIVTEDETCIHHYTTESKCHTIE